MTIEFVGFEKDVVNKLIRDIQDLMGAAWSENRFSLETVHGSCGEPRVVFTTNSIREIISAAQLISAMDELGILKCRGLEQRDKRTTLECRFVKKVIPAMEITQATAV